MYTQISSGAIDSSQLDQMLGLLNCERKTTRWQDRMFKLLIAALVSQVITILLNTILISIFANLQVLSIVLLIISGLLLFAIAVLFFLNLPFIFRLRRLNKMVHSLGLSEVFRPPWKLERKRHRIRNIFTIIITCFGVLLIAGGISLFIEDSSRTIELIFGLFYGTLFVFIHFFIKMKEKIDVVRQMQTILTDYKEKADLAEEKRIEISPEEYDLFAKIEQVQITRERAESILASQEESDEASFLVQKSPAVREATSKLDETTQVQIQDQICSLTVDPRPSIAVEDTEKGDLSIDVPSAPIKILYSVNDELRRIKIQSLEIDEKIIENSINDENGNA